MSITYGEALQRVAERTVDNRSDIRKKNFQRRTNFTNLYGTPHVTYINENDNAEARVSIPKDVDRWNRYEFKIIIEKTEATNFRVLMSGRDVTAYLMAQQDGNWITGEGIYPSTDIIDDDANYDVLQVISDIHAEGEEDYDTMLEPGLRRIEIVGDKPIQATVITYLSYSHLNK